jgi:DNA-binding response OmpR family regulator
MTTILVVDDDRSIARIIGRYLEQAGYMADLAGNGAEALAALAVKQYDLIILDVLLPDTTGLEICRSVRQQKSGFDGLPLSSGPDLPILMLSALGLTDDIVDGLRCGADDYIVKPFEPRELTERVRTLLRRSREHQAKTMIATGDLVLDETCNQIICREEPLSLTRREYDLLAHLIRHPEHLFSRDDLLTAVWGWDFAGNDRVVDLCILRVRKKLEAAGCRHASIETRRGSGYQLHVSKV